jgi:uncharacterized membrane protein YtjA (UPF0391 family)
MSLLKWALIFFLISVVAGIFGFTGISAASADLARNHLLYLPGDLYRAAAARHHDLSSVTP